MNSPAIRTDAIISDCGRYRYILYRQWDASCDSLVFCMLNPSTADASQDDPTIRRCIGFAKANGYGGIVVVNLFAFRATDPKKIPLELVVAMGPNNVMHMREAAKGRDVVAAWGANPLASVTRPALQLLHAYANRVLCLGCTKAGAPRHPLYVAGEQPLIPYEAPNA
ncbi:hypothetical protein SAMN04487785_11438 [Dyella jiangningensis]|uniref:DUF1643 domain-containing protein n=1 Tax=Dyella sp. AtDHG13 TaxID=1938897 RepID=UPI000882DAFC|nr:DUF1643 domain-containing protein [Dyella sp. AtDHG13]PXV54183.1 hypothetical protein BDW41_113136 [Dyella sp. AtDHG13]SDL05017.1 hypothetical protein SAMN04487785_11438 [Dyella jiangningensis]